MPTALATFALLLLISQTTAAQPPSPVPASRFTPIGVEPHQAPVPLHSGPQLEVRTASAQEPIPAEAKPPLRLAPRTESKSASLARPSRTTPGRALGTVAGSLVAVLGLFLVIAWCLQRTSPKGNQPLPKEAVELLGQAPLTPRQQMQLIRLGNKLVLLALTPTGAETLSEITDPTEVEHLLALCRRQQPGSSSATFQQTLTHLANERPERPLIAAPRTNSRGGR